MPKKAALLLYHNLENINEDKSYWEKYIKFHELYWDGPASSQGVFYGREYEEYRESLSKYLEREISQIKDCLFTAIQPHVTRSAKRLVCCPRAVD